MSSLQGLLALAMLMAESIDEARILHLATSAVPSFCGCTVGGVYLFNAGWQLVQPPCATAAVQDAVEKQFSDVGSSGGELVIEGSPWGWGYPVRGLQGHLGYLIAVGDEALPAHELFLMHQLVHHTGVALTNARLHASERGAMAELRATNEALGKTVAALERSTQIHDRLTRVASAGEGAAGIATAVYDLTGYSVAVEDRHGNLLAWGGPHRPEAHTKAGPATRERLLQDMERADGPLRTHRGLMAAAAPRDDILGVLVLIDPDHTAGDQELVALEHGATVLAMELARLRGLDETELRLGRDLVEELLSGGDERGALARARALGYDLERQHRVVVVECVDESGGDGAFHAVRRVARDLLIGSLLVARGDVIVLLAERDADWARVREAVSRDAPQLKQCRIGVGGVCERPSEFRRSLDEAELALRVQRETDSVAGATSFDALGIYRLLARIDDPSALQRFVTEWLGALVDYDERRGGDLVLTLTEYLNHGGSYADTSTALAVHRSTLKYRLQRIREISGRDLSDPDTQFNLQLATRAWQTLQALRA